MATKYVKLSSEDSPPEDEVGVDMVRIDVNNNQVDSGLSLKILFKETSFLIDNLSLADSVLDLKKSVSQISEVPIISQRLIFAGKPLKPDDKPLSFFKIENNSNIHLFPIPIAQSVSVTSPTSTNIEIATPVANPMLDRLPFTPTSTFTGESDPVYSQSSREVRLWSLILLFLSSMTLINNLSYYVSSGRFGVSVVDSLVTLSDTLTSAVGIYVGQMGIDSSRTGDLSVVKKYIKWLTILAIGSVLMRVLWVVDVILQVQKAVDDSHDPTKANDASSQDSKDTGTNTTGPLSQKLVVSFGIQATMIALIIISAWLNCVRRAYNFHDSVVRYHESNGSNRQS